MLSAKDLEERSKAKKNLKKELYTRILSQFCRRIDMFHTLGKTDCSLRVPEFVFGYPAYDVFPVTLYMHRQLVRLGYRTSVLGEGLLHVAWGPKPKKKSTTKNNTEEDSSLPSFANLRKAADDLRKKYTSGKVK
jgi:hypothetical protein